MKIVLRLILLAVVVAGGIWLWTILFPSPETIIRRRLADLAKTVSYTGTEGLLSRAASIQKLTGFFVNEIEVTFDYPKGMSHTISGRDEITAAAAAAPSTVGMLQVEFLDPNVTLAADKQSAIVDVTLRARVPEDKAFIVQEMKFTLKKIKDEWMIIRIETVRILSQLSPTTGRNSDPFLFLAGRSDFPDMNKSLTASGENLS